MALDSLLCVDVPLSNCSCTHIILVFYLSIENVLFQINSCRMGWLVTKLNVSLDLLSVDLSQD